MSPRLGGVEFDAYTVPSSTMPSTVRSCCELGWPRVGTILRSAVLLGTIILSAVFCVAQISPGPLSKAHRSLSGPTQCTSCHRVGAGSANFKCLECHTEIRQRIAEKRGLHASFAAVSESQKECVTCHSEHNGEDFAITHWDPTPGKFDHDKTGYVLEGKHAGLQCAKCHVSQHITGEARRELAGKDLGHTFLGLSRGCATCHEDKHNGRLGQNCQQCHNFNDWKGVAVEKQF